MENSNAVGTTHCLLLHGKLVKIFKLIKHKLKMQKEANLDI